MQLLKILAKAPYAVIMILFATISITTLSSDFLFIDDIALIVNNPQLNFSVANLVSIVTRPLGQIFDASDYAISFIYYRPALNFLYMLNTSIWGINPVGFHLSNLLLHLLTTILVYRTGLLLLERHKELALLAAAIFCVHPVHNELIGRVAMNENLLGFFIVASFHAYLQGRRLLSLFVFALALLTKESAVMVPFLFMVFQLRKQSLKETVAYLSPYFVVMGIYFGIRGAVVGIPELSSGVNLLAWSTVVSAALAGYLRLLVFPYPLHIYYPVWQASSLSGLFLSVATCLLLGYALWRWRKEPLLASLLWGLVVLLVPVLVKANQMILGSDRAFIAERQLYVPTIFFSLLIAALIMKYGDCGLRKYVAESFIMVIPLFVYATCTATAAWKNDAALSVTFAQSYPDSSLAHKRKGGLLFDQGDLDGALAEFKAALPAAKVSISNESKRDNAAATGGKTLANLLDKHAMAAYQPEYADLHYNIGQIHRAKGDSATAMKKFNVVIALQPNFIEAHTALGELFMKQKRYREASREFKLALKYIEARRRAG